MAEDEFEQFKKQVNDLECDITLGKVRSVSFAGGPKDGDNVFMNWENGHPKTLKQFFIVPNVFKFSEPVEKAEYEWCIKDEIFVFTGRTKQDFIQRQ
jgi:hypothetical protein